MTRSASDVGGKQLKEELAMLRRRLDESETKNKELEAFNYTVAHDLYAPLLRIEGYSGILLENYVGLLDEEGEGYVRRVSRAAQQAKRLLNDMLNLSRAANSDLSLKEVDLTAMVQEILDDCCQSEPGREIEIVIEPGMCVYGDSVMMWMMMMNLLSNAWKFSGKTEKARIEVGSYLKEGETVFFVRDNGVGFEPEEADQLFVAFKRLRQRSEFDGTGIGLATVARVIARHGGKVWAEGRPGNGATFLFVLPAQHS